MRELWYAARHLGGHPWFTLVVAVTLGLGIGLVALQISVIDALLLRPLPFAQADRIVHIAHQNDSPESGNHWAPVSFAEYEQMRAQQALLNLAAFQERQLSLRHDQSSARRISGYAVSADFFAPLGVSALLGRVFEPGDDLAGQAPKLVISERLWRDEFGADPTLIGSSVRLDGEIATLIGVMPASFEFPSAQDFWLNLVTPAAGPDNAMTVQVVGVLHPGQSTAAAALALQAVATRLQQSSGEAAAIPVRVLVQPFAAANQNTSGVILLATMLALTLFVLALACVNASSLIYAHAAARVHELAVRNALGAGGMRIARQLLSESMVLAALGALVGVGLAALGVRLIERYVRSLPDVPLSIYFQIDTSVLIWTLLLMVLAGLGAGMVPAWRAGRSDLNASLRDHWLHTGASKRGPGRWLVGVQLAFAATGMLMATLLAMSAVSASRGNLGFAPDSLLSGRVDLSGPAYDQPLARSRFYEQLMEQIGATPGVVAVAVSSRDLVEPAVSTRVELDDRRYLREDDKPQAWLEVVSRDYFAVVDRPAASGRVFNRSDVADGPAVALVNRSFAEQHWPGESAIGKRVRRSEDQAQWATVVGVVPDLNLAGLRNGGASAGWYLLQDQQAWGWMNVLVRTRGDARTLIGPVRAAVAAVDPEQPIHSIGSLSERTVQRTADLLLVGTLALCFAAAALFLAAIGLYGVIAHASERRIPEFGLRMALGAQRAGLTRMVVLESLPRTLIGVGVGLAVGYLLAQPLARVLPAAANAGLSAYALVASILLLTTLVASWLPARRASKANPICRG